MTLGLFPLLSVLLLPPLLGAGLLRAIGIGPRSDSIAWLGWSILVGALGTSAFVFLFLALGLPLEARWLGSAVGGTGALLLLVLRGRRTCAPLPLGDAWTSARLERALFHAVLLGCIALSVEGTLVDGYWPIHKGDEAHLWESRAQVMFHVGELGAEYAEEMGPVRRLVNHADYPPLNPLLQTWVYAHAGEVVHVENRYPIQVFAIALLLILAAALRRYTRPAVAVGLLFLLFSQHWTRQLTSYVWSDLMLATCVLAAFDAWLRREEAPSRSWGALCGVALAGMVWTKNEGLMILVVMVVAAGLAWLVRPIPNPAAPGSKARERGPVWTWLWLPFAVAVLHQAVNLRFGFENDIVGAAEGEGLLDRLSGQFGERTGLVLSFYGNDVLFDRSSRGLVFVFVALALVFPARLVRGPRIAPTLAITAVLAGYALVFVASPHFYIEWHLETAAARTAWHVVPAIVLWLGMSLATLYPSTSARRV